MYTKLVSYAVAQACFVVAVLRLSRAVMDSNEKVMMWVIVVVCIVATSQFLKILSDQGLAGSALFLTIFGCILMAVTDSLVLLSISTFVLQGAIVAFHISVGKSANEFINQTQYRILMFYLRGISI
jgi:hypothetical protein